MLQYSEKYKVNISLLFLLSFLFFQPILKYGEYVLNLPRVNFSIVILTLFILYLISISDFIYKKHDFNLLLSFWLIFYISIVQIISIPWAINYSSSGLDSFLKIISKTFFCYWMFWFSGLHIKDVINHKYSKYFFTISWLLSVLMIILNSLNNDIFMIILEGKLIYLMLGDCFAVLSIFTLMYNKKYDLLILLLSAIALFALWSRASLYSFVAISILYMIKEHKIKFFLSLVGGLLLLDYLFLFKDDRMLRIIFGGFDASQSIRQRFLMSGLNELRMVWPFGHFMGDVNSTYGHMGTYIHSYLSLMRQFGIIPFLMFIVLIISYYYRLFFSWIKTDSKYINFLFYFTSFVLVEIIFARSYLHPFIWMSLSSSHFLTNNKT
mgnify:CR=1 FL=1